MIIIVNKIILPIKLNESIVNSGGTRSPREKVRELRSQLGLHHWMLTKGPSIYDVHTEGGQAQVDACGRGEGVQPHVDVHTEN